jgi:Mg-chelatase subunit ChlD
MANAVDEELRRLALMLACSVFIDLARGTQGSSGSGHLVSRPLRPGSGGDLDIDRSPDELALRRHGVLTGDEVHEVNWVRPPTSACLLIDRSGSMSGAALATAALSAAAVCLRLPRRHAVISFAGDVTHHVAFDDPGEPNETVERMLALRGHGTTDLRGGLDAALAVADAAPAGRHLTILLSDCRATDLSGVESAAEAVPELAILAPSADHHAAMGLARAVDARLFLLEGPRDVVSALDGAFSRR